jgi:hypothetical protein
MGITGEISAVIQNSKEQFEKAMTVSLTTDTLKNIVLRSVPTDESDVNKINDPKFRESFNRILSPITANIIDKYQSVGQFDTGNLFTSMVTSIADSVSLESTYRAQSLESKFLLDKIPITPAREWVGEIKKTFESLQFSEPDIKKRFSQNLKFILSAEDGKKIIEDIKDEVKNSIDETESKNELVEGTLQEIADYKKEVAPPDDEYLDAENPDDQAKANGESEEESGEETGNENGQDESTETGETTDETPSPGAEEELTEDEGDDLEGDSNLEETEEDTNLNTDEAPIPPPAEEPPPQNDPTKITTKQGNVVININATSGESFTAKVLKKAKSTLLLHTAESFGSAFIPIHDRDINDMDLPDKFTMASEGVNAIGDVKREIDIRLSGAKYALSKSTASTEDKQIIAEKIDKLATISKEAAALVDIWSQSLQKLGLTQNGLLNSNESTLSIAQQIISRFLADTRSPTPLPLPYTSKENILTNAFDILQLRQTLKSQENPNPEAVKDLISRENVFYHNVVSIDDPETKEKATAVVDLTDMIFKKAITANFITDYRIKAWEQNVGKDQKDTNTEVVSRVEKKFERLWQRPLNNEEKAIVSATTNNEDVTEIIPTPYEKFLIKLTKESMFDKSIENNNQIAPLSPKENENNRFKAKLFTTILKSLEHFNLVNKYDFMEVDKFCNSTNLNLLHIGKSTESNINEDGLLK